MYLTCATSWLKDRMARHAALWLAAIALGVLLVSSSAFARVTITYWGISSVEAELVEEWNAMHGDRIYVEQQDFPAGQIPERLTLAVAGHVAPDLVRADRFTVPSLAALGLLQPLDPLIERHGVDVNDYWPGAIGEGYFEGQLYALPWDIGARALLWHKNLFAAAGLNPDVPPATWEEMEAASRAMNRIDSDGSIDQLGFIPSLGQWHFFGQMIAAGGEMLDPTGRHVVWNNEIGVRALEWHRKGLEWVGPGPIINEWFNSHENGAFVAGHLAAIIAPQGQIVNARDANPNVDLGVGPPPRPAGLEGTPVSWSGGFGVAIPSGAPNPEAAFEFAKWITGEYAQLQLGLKARFPVNRHAATDPRFLENDPLFAQVIQLMPYAQFRPQSPVGNQLSSIYQNRTNALLIDQGLPPEQVLEITAREAQQLLDDYWNSRR